MEKALSTEFKELESIIAKLLKGEDWSTDLIPEIKKFFEIARKTQEENDILKKYKKISERTGEREKEYVGPPNYDYSVCSA